MSTMQPATILLVDDDPLVRDSATRLLQEQGLKVIACSDGYEAMNRLDEGIVDAVLSDIKMPGLTGLELLEKIRNFDPEIPVLLMTGYADLEMAVAAIQGGVFDFILKPFNPPHLFHAVDKALSFKHLRLFEKNFHTELTRRLAEAKQELQIHYDQMLQREKHASADQVATRLGQNIQQPVDFIVSNLGTLNRYVEQLLACIASQEQMIKTSSPESVRAEVEELHRNLDLEHIRQQIKPLLTESLQGARKIRTIIKNVNTEGFAIQLD